MSIKKTSEYNYTDLLVLTKAVYEKKILVRSKNAFEGLYTKRFIYKIEIQNIFTSIIEKLSMASP